MMNYYGAETVGGTIWNSGRKRWGQALDNAITTIGSKQMNADLMGKDYLITLFILDENRITHDVEIKNGFQGIKEAIDNFAGDLKFYLNYVVQIECF